jgi:WD40 repeat protein
MEALTVTRTARLRAAPRETLSPDGQLLLFSSNRGFGSEPLDHPLRFEELEQRIHAPHNGLRDVHVVGPGAPGL